MEEFIDPPFTLDVDILETGKPLTFDLIPFWDKDAEEMQYDVLLDGVTVGIVHLIDINEWGWIDSSFTPEMANLIGHAIEDRDR